VFENPGPCTIARRDAQSGQVTVRETFTYDELARPLTHEVDGGGNADDLPDGEADELYRYHWEGEILVRREMLSPASENVLETMTVVRDEAGRISTLDEARSMAHLARTVTRDGQGRITSIVEGDSAALSFEYDEAGNVISSEQDGGFAADPVDGTADVRRTYSYDERGHLIGVEITPLGQGNGLFAPQSGTKTLVWNEGGQLVEVSSAGGGWADETMTLAYEDGHLVREASGSDINEYGYDCW